jgi:DNA-binding transcriptional ArsR family regulator
MRVSMWQDGAVTPTHRPGPEELDVRVVADAQTLKALADPLRLALLAALMRRGPAGLRIMSVKELAAEISEPQTKLYRHMKLLEATGLIRVAETRVVSGILEQRYQARQTDLRFGRDLLHEQGTADEAAVVLAAMFDAYRDRLFATYRDHAAASGAGRPWERYREPLLGIGEMVVSPARAAELRGQLRQLIDDLNEPAAHDPDSVEVSAMIAFYARPVPPKDGHSS